MRLLIFLIESITLTTNVHLINQVIWKTNRNFGGMHGMWLIIYIIKNVDNVIMIE